MKNGVKVIAINEETGDERRFERVKDAAEFAGVKNTTMSHRIRTRAVDKNGYYYIAEELSEEQLARKYSRCKNPPPKMYKSDNVEMDGTKYKVVHYEVRNLRESITPCPYRDFPKPMVGSAACQKCTSFKGRNRETHEVMCNRTYI